MKVNAKPLRKFLMWITLIVGTIVILFLLISQFTPNLSIWLIRPLIGGITYAEPPNIETVRQNVNVVSDLQYDAQKYSELDIYYPSNAESPLPVLVYIHGGGFVAADKSAFQALAMSIAHEGYLVANINYGLAPEQAYPTAITQVNQALAYLNDHIEDYGGDINRIFIAGNSAGAQLSSQMAAIITNEELASDMGLTPNIAPDQLKGVALISGIYNMQTVRATKFPLIGLFLWAYTGVRDFETYARVDEISTVKYVTSNYPPVFITVGDIDPLESQTLEMIDVLENNAIDVTAVLFTGSDANLDHDFLAKLDQQQSQETFAQLISFLNQHKDA